MVNIGKIKDNILSMKNVLDELYNIYYEDLAEDDLPEVSESIQSIAHNIARITNLINK